MVKGEALYGMKTLLFAAAMSVLELRINNSRLGSELKHMIRVMEDQMERKMEMKWKLGLQGFWS